MLVQPHVGLPIRAQVTHEDAAVFRAACKERRREIAPGEGADAVRVADESANLLACFDVPDLHLAILRSHAQMFALVGPAERCDRVVDASQIS